nr:solute carrier family 23 member 1-like [Lytechinus pictus]
MQNGKEVDPAVDGIHVSTVSSPTSSATNGRMPSARYEVEDDAEDAARKEADEILAKLKGDISYGIEDTPAWYTSVLLGFQHYLTMIGSTIAIPLILAPYLCISDDNVALAEVIATMFFVSGVATLLQTFIGNRLPIVQGGTFSFLAPTFAILSVKGPCPPPLSVNASVEEVANQTEVFQSRIREIQGDIMVASLFQVVIGFTGTIGIMLRFIGPLSITPTICLIGLALFKEAADFASGHWGIAFMTMALMTIFSQYIARFGVPFFRYTKENRCHFKNVFIFKLFPVILAILIFWDFCAILTATTFFQGDDWVPSRDRHSTSSFTGASGFSVPYPDSTFGIPVFLDIIMLVLGTFTKFSAIFVMIPDPIVGGMFCIMFGMVAAVGLSNLQFVDLNSSRNLFILGFSLFMGFLYSQNDEIGK